MSSAVYISVGSFDRKCFMLLYSFVVNLSFGYNWIVCGLIMQGHLQGHLGINHNQLHMYLVKQ